MNKETIKKFKNEFEWWLDYGQIWQKNPGNGNWFGTSRPSFRFDFLYAIPDEFVEERKAFAEGKEIEFNADGFWEDTKGMPSWIPGTKYRIKPETWYLNIPERGRLCWVSDVDNVLEKVDIIMSYAKTPHFNYRSICGSGWEYATPLTDEEIKQFLTEEK